eukprot:GHVS01074149.1.p3 GENE.GHVS01074149.1~~GHVS01074149.1.p3  ORF type:complete len:120 (-),score=13.82 GHVS01074149.1:703-1062(-)
MVKSGRSFILETDASEKGAGAVLKQEQVLEFASTKFSPTQSRWSTCSPNRSRFAPMDGHGIRHISGPTNKVADLLSRLIDTSHDDDEPEEFLLPPMPTLQEFEADGNDIPEAEKKWHRE